MNKIALVAVVLSTLGVAQSPLVTLTGGTNQGNIGGGLYFNLQVNTAITVTQIDFRCGATTLVGTGTVDVFLGPSTYRGNVTNFALWTLVTSATMPVAPSAVSLGVLATPIGLAPGNYGVALRSSGFSHGYTNGVGCTSTTIPGACTNSLFSNAEITLRAGAAQNAFLVGGVFEPRIFNGAIHYTLGGPPTHLAVWEPIGSGCYGRYRSFYQLFPNPVGLNIGNANPVRALRLGLRPGSYSVSAVNSPVVTPTSSPIPLLTGDETFLASRAFAGNVLPFPIPHPLGGTVVTASDLEISTEGYIVPRPATLPNDTTPTVAEFLQLVPRWCAHWKNMNPVAAGSSMHVEHDAVNGAILVTWMAVVDNALLTTSTFQVAFYQGGDVEYRYGVMSTGGGGTLPVIIGWTEGNNSLDPGFMEIATSLPFDTESSDNHPLRLEADARPLLGTTLNLVTSSIPLGSPIGVLLLGVSPIAPPLSLAFINMPDCFLHVTPDVTFGLTISGTMNSFPLQVPNLSSMNGARVFWESVTLSGGFNLAGLIASNGLRLSLGRL